MDHLVDEPAPSTTGSSNEVNAGVVVSVCTTCKPAEGDAAIGQTLLDATRTAIDGAATVRAVQCLGVCKRPATVAVSAPDGYTFVFGDLDPQTGPEAIASFVRSYRGYEHGFVPWSQRPELLRSRLVARIPSPGWSPDDGRPPA